MSKWMCVLLMTLTTSLFAGTVAADGMDWGVGYQGVFLGDFLQGISARAWFDEVGVEANFSQTSINMSGDKMDLYMGGLKGLYCPIVKDHSKFYVGFEGQYGNLDAMGMKADILQFGPLFGAEYFFTELPEMGFCWEVGYRFLDTDMEGSDLELSGISIGLGLHYYFK